MLERLHAEGRYIKTESGKTIILRGCHIYDINAYIDHLYANESIASRVAILKDLGVPSVRISIIQNSFNANTDTNGDGIGCKDFYYQFIDALTAAGIYVTIGLMYDMTWTEAEMAANPQMVIDWYINNFVTKYKDNPGFAGIFIFNEPHYDAWGGSSLGDGLYSGYWNAMKQICAGLHAVNPNLLMIVHADTSAGFCATLRTDPIPTPNVVYTWHYYYCHGPQFNPYLGWMSGVLDPNWQELVNRGQPFYKSYAFGDYANAKQEFEQYLYNGYLWVPTELNLPVINDEFGFNGDEESYFSYRACQICLAANGGVPKSGITFWYVSQTLDAPGGSPVSAPYPDVTYCPICGAALPKPRAHSEPGWSQCMLDFTEILDKYYCNWQYFTWWVKTYGGYGLCTGSSMTALGKVGVVWECLLLAYVLTVASTPMANVSVTIDNQQVGGTPISVTLNMGSHQVSVPEEVVI